MSDLINRCIHVSASMHAIMKIFFVSNVQRVREFIPLTFICVTLTYDFEIQGYVIYHFTRDLTDLRYYACCSNEFVIDSNILWSR